MARGWPCKGYPPLEHLPGEAFQFEDTQHRSGMTVEWVQQFCMGLPHATEAVQWENNLVFKVGGKMFAIAALEPGRVWLSFKCAPEDFAELTERPGIVPAPYLARASWVGLEHTDSLNRAELGRYLRSAYDVVVAKLPRKLRDTLTL